MSLATSHITLEMMLAESKRILEIMKDSYPEQVAKGKLTPYEKNHRINCHSKMVELLEQAIQNRKTDTTHLSKLLEHQL